MSFSYTVFIRENNDLSMTIKYSEKRLLAGRCSNKYLATNMKTSSCMLYQLKLLLKYILICFNLNFLTIFPLIFFSFIIKIVYEIGLKLESNAINSCDSGHLASPSSSKFRTRQSRTFRLRLVIYYYSKEFKFIGYKEEKV